MNVKARVLRELHQKSVLVLPNAWDAASAALIARAGAAAVATTSGGVAWAQGRGDGEGLTRDEMIAAVSRIVAVVPVPVSADVEGGYGETPEDVGATVRAAVAAGVAGVNIEDARAADGSLRPPAEQAGRIRAARAAAGVRRISVGTAVAQAAYAVADRAARELLTTGTYASLAAAADYGDLNTLLGRDVAGWPGRPAAPSPGTARLEA
jgi:2-methylisocitrate lyase-like PEP mutase family enzyme